jgi:DNA-binding response OmpR family regulator
VNTQHLETGDEPVEVEAEHAHGGREQGEPQQSLEAGLRAQLDRVLDEVWLLAREQAGSNTTNVSIAQLAFRLCALYPQPAPEQEQRIALGALSLELHSSEVCTENGRVRLTRRELALLRYLLEHRGMVVTRYELMCEIWQSATGTSPRTVDIHIHRLRAKLGDWFADRIETVHSVGYKLSFTPLSVRGERARRSERAHAADDAEAGTIHAADAE